VGHGQLGVASKLLRASKAFYLLAKLPLEVSEGDAIALPVTLRNRSDAPLKLRLKAQISGGFKLMEDPLPGPLSLPAGQSRTYFYPIRVKARRGKGTIHLKATGPGISDAIVRQISIRPRGIARIFQTSAPTPPKSTRRFTLELPKQRSQLQAQSMLDVDPMTRANQALKSIVREPHGCFEQTSSANYPNIMVLRYLKRHGAKVSASFRRRVYGMLRRGYKKLVGYETPTGGFSLFGRAPGNPAITAYGLLQFQALAKVYGGVDPAMRKRVTQWLMKQRDGKGGYRTHGSGGHFSYANPQITAAYITYALTRLGQRGLQRERQALREWSADTSDPYLLALALNTFARHAGKDSPITQGLRRRLQKLQRPHGGFVGTSTSITGSRRLSSAG